MAFSKFDICSKALIELGKEPISSFQDESNLNAAAICAVIWDDYARYILCAHSWKFNMRKQQLGRVATAPLNEWLYAYQMPSDCLKLEAIRDSESTGRMTFLGYDILQDKVVTNAQFIYADYQIYVEPSSWPSWFVEFAVMALAAKLAPPITNQVDIADRKSLIAWGPPQDNFQGGLFGRAKIISDQQAPPQPITHFELLEARFS